MMRVGMVCVVAGAVAVGAAGCGGSTATSPSPNPSGTNPNPNPGPPPGGGGGSLSMTISIGADGRVSPTELTVPVGARVSFVNNHNRSHDMNSDPHPDHTDCPAINQVGFIQPGETKHTGALNTARTCGFHDHNEPSNTALQGTIRVQ